MSIINICEYLQRNRKTITVLFMIIMLLNIILSENALGGNGETTKQVESLRTRIVKAVKDIAYPLGGALVFVSIILISIKIIVSHYNPNARGQAMEGLQWVAIGAVLLGSAILVANIMISMGGMDNLID